MTQPFRIPRPVRALSAVAAGMSTEGDEMAGGWPDTRVPVRASPRTALRAATAVCASAVLHVVALLSLPGATHVHEPEVEPLRVRLAAVPPVEPVVPPKPAPVAPPPPPKPLPQKPVAPPKPAPPKPAPSPAPPPPPAPAPAPAPTQQPAPVAPPAPSVQAAPPAPAAVPAAPPPREEPPPARPSAESTRAAPPPASPPPRAASAPYSPPSAQAGHLTNPRPDYPRASQRRGEEGTVTLRVTVGADGRPLRVSVERSSGFPALDRAALEKVSAAWRFVPARRGDQPVEGEVLVPVTFELSGG